MRRGDSGIMRRGEGDAQGDGGPGQEDNGPGPGGRFSRQGGTTLGRKLFSQCVPGSALAVVKVVTNSGPSSLV